MITVEVNKQQEEKPKDIFFQGNYVISDVGTIVHVSGVSQSDVECFLGQPIKSVQTHVKEGEYHEKWRKGAFTQFTGTITITSK